VEPQLTGLYLVTGGAGFIGSHLVEHLLRLGACVRVLDDFSSGTLANLQEVESEVEIINGSILNQASILAATQGVDGIFHLAARVSVPESFNLLRESHDVNLTAALMLIEAAKKQGCPFVFSSSAAVYGSTTSLPVTESDNATNPLSPYGVQKLAAESYCEVFKQVHEVRGVSLRYFNVYGPRQAFTSPYSGVISKFVAAALRNEPLRVFGDGSSTRDFVFVDDVVRANVFAISRAQRFTTALNIGTGVETSIASLAHQIIQITNSRSPVVYGEPRSGDVKRSVAATGKAMKEIGWSYISGLQEGLEKTIGSMRTAVI